jgi:hypothetical protein
MNIFRWTLLLSVPLWLVPFAGSQVPTPIAERIRKGEDAAVLEAGRSKDPEYLEMLRAVAEDPEYEARYSAILALAKLGDWKARQYFACRSLIDGFEEIPRLLQDLQYIEGALSIEIYRRLLDSDARFQAEFKRDLQVDPDKYSDVGVTFPSSWVLFDLPKVVPNPPAAAPPRYLMQIHEDEPLKALWRQWLREHEQEIRNLQPTAASIKFDRGFCEDLERKAADSH